MAYTTRAKIQEKITEDVLIGLTDDNNAGSVNDTVMDEAIENADAEIDGYIGVKYTLPLSSTPIIVQKYSTVISVKNLYERRAKVPESVRKAYEDAVAFLKLVGKGTASIGIDIPRDSKIKTDGVEIRSNPRKLSYDVANDTGRMDGFI